MAEIRKNSYELLVMNVENFLGILLNPLEKINYEKKGRILDIAENDWKTYIFSENDI